MKIIDTHTHIGESKFTGVKTAEESLMNTMEKHNIMTSLVMPQPTFENVPEVHKKIYHLSKEYPGRIYGLVNLDPNLPLEQYSEEVGRCVEEFGFVGLKIHPLGHNISPLSSRCEKVYKLAEKYNIPVLVHTGTGNPFALPSLVIDAAMRYPDVTFILCHSGFAVYTDEAMVAAKHCSNIILEPSWCPTYTVQKMVDWIGIDKIIFGSDHLTNLPVELTKYRSIDLKEEQKRKIFYNNPKRIFHLDV